jgi:hypothetical protein
MRLATALLVMAGAMTPVPMMAFHDPYERGGVGRDDDYREDRRYRRNQRYGYGQYGRSQPGSGVIERTMSDLDRAARSAQLDNHERNHFSRAMQQLSQFRDRWSRGEFNRGNLDKAIEDVQHLVNADRVHPRDRDLLARDLTALRDFRANRGAVYGGYSPRYDPYGSYRPF